MNVRTGYKKTLLKVVAALCLMACGTGAGAQTNLETFGQNRIQYRKFAWRFFETKHFRIYHYDAAGRGLARYVAEQVETDIQAIEKKLGGQFPNRFKIIVYNSYDDYRQTNIGKKSDSQLQDVPAGTVNLVGDKLIVYYNGVHTDLRRQTRSGMSRVVMERMLFGESFREMVKNAVLLNMPQWTIDGFIAYLVDGWTPEANSQWKNLMNANPSQGFYTLAEKEPELAGKAFWKYISDKYGQGEMKNLLYTMQMKASVNQAVKMNLGYNIRRTYDSTMEYYRTMYTLDETRQEQPDSNTALIEIGVPKDNTVIRDIKVAPKGNDVAYVAWKDGEYRVYQQKTKNQQERSVLLEGGRKDYNEQPDPNYPLMAWSNNGYKLAILYRKGTETRLRIYNSLKAKIENYVIPKNRFDRVLSMTFMEDDNNLVFSAIKKSQTDLYQFTIRGKKMTNITNDAWNDVDPWFVSGGSRKGILFLSNRPKPNLVVPVEVNQLPTGPMNVFFYNTRTMRKELLQMSDVKTGEVSQPIQYGSENYAYLYDVNGVRNKYVVLLGRDARNMDSAYALPITNYSTNIISHQYNPSSNQVADVLQDGDKYKVYFKPLEIPGVNIEPKQLEPSILSTTEASKTSSASYESLMPETVTETARPVDNSRPVLPGGNVFQSEFDTEEPAEQATDAPETTAAASVEAEESTPNTPDPDTATSEITIAVPVLNSVDSAYIKMKAEPYRLSFRPDFFSVKLDNTVLFNRYQAVNLNGGAYTNPALGGMLTVSLDDLMENHRFTGGLRLPINFSGTSYFLQYENFTRRTDWGILFLRTDNFKNETFQVVDSTGTVLGVSEQLIKVTTSMVQASASYPLDRIRSIKGHLGLREDKLNIKAQDGIGLTGEIDNSKQYWSLARLEYVFDNTLNPTINIYNGFRYKFFAEYLYQLNNGNGGFYNLGVDFRYYKKLHKNFIWATRLAGAHSAGNQKIVYYLGGVDNWINPQYSSHVPVRPTENYAFQALATNLRGYAQNSRNGNTYAVINTELRLPVLTTFLKRPIQSALLKNLQLVAFADAGSAWTGFLPNADALRNDKYLPDPSNLDPNGNFVFLTIKDETGGLGLGYGGGIRTSMFGYFVRFDVAWNIEGRKKPMGYLSIGTDF